MTDSDLFDRLSVLGRRSLAIGGGALVLSALLALLWPREFFSAYLVGFFLAAGVALGSLALLGVQHVATGEWGFVSRRVLEASSRTLVWLPLFFLPIVAGAPWLYPWWGPEETSEVLAHKASYLNPLFFLVRAAVYFGVWAWIATRLDKYSREQDRGERARVSRLQTFGAVGLLLYGLTVTFASVDWVMSLEPEWFSTVYGLLVMVGQVLSALVFTVLVLRFLAPYEPLAEKLRPSHFHDLGNLILAFVLLWAYLSFSQYLIIWSGNLPEEIPWYLRRTGGGWSFVALALALVHFALPFFLLLSRRNKKSTDTLARIAYVVLAARWIDALWLVKPSSVASVSLHVLDVLAPLGVLALWLGLFFREVGKAPLLPLHDPRFADFGSEEALHGAH